MDGLRHDLRGALRALIRRPGFSALAILTLGAGIGLNAVAFTAANALFIKGHAGAHVPDAGWVFRGASGPLSIPDVDTLSRDARSFSIVAAEGRLPLALSWRGGAEPVWTLLVSPGYFDVIDERPIAGRTIDAGSPGDDRAVVVSERFWRERFADAPLAGQTVTLNDVDFGVIGIIREGAHGPGGLYTPDIWVPLGARRAMQLPANLDEADRPWLTVIARLAPGMTPAGARGEVAAIFGTGDPGAPQAAGDFVLFRDKHPESRQLRWLGVIGMSAVGIVLLIACFNVAGLLLARSIERTREMAVRRSLGAGAARLARQLLAENLVLAAGAGLAALLLAYWSGSLLASFALPAPIPQRLDLRPDGALLLFVAALVAVAALLPAIAPAMQAMRVDVVHALKAESAGGGKSSRARSAFVALQVAGSTLFLAVALLLGQSFAQTMRVDPGFEQRNALVLEVEPALQGFAAPQSRAMVEAFVDRLRAMPGIVAAGSGDRISFYVGRPHTETVAPDSTACAASTCPEASVYKIGTDYLAGLGVSLVEGREFTDDDVRHRGRALVSAALAAELWPGTAAAGRLLRLPRTNELVEIVGVTSDIKHRSMHEATVRALYLPIEDEDYRNAVTVVARTSGPPEAVAAAARSAWRALDSRLPLPVVQTMSDRLRLPMWPVRTAAWFFGICSALAVLLATVGLFGAIAYAAAQRTREFGIRAAIGASSPMLARLVAGDALRLAAPGVAIGLGGAWLVVRATGARLPGIDASDPSTFAIVAALQLAVAMAACLVPARRAASVDPIICLRAE